MKKSLLLCLGCFAALLFGLSAIASPMSATTVHTQYAAPLQTVALNDAYSPRVAVSECRTCATTALPENLTTVNLIDMTPAGAKTERAMPGGASLSVATARASMLNYSIKFDGGGVS